MPAPNSPTCTLCATPMAPREPGHWVCPRCPAVHLYRGSPIARDFYDTPLGKAYAPKDE